MPSNAAALHQSWSVAQSIVLLQVRAPPNVQGEELVLQVLCDEMRMAGYNNVHFAMAALLMGAPLSRSFQPASLVHQLLEVTCRQEAVCVCHAVGLLSAMFAFARLNVRRTFRLITGL